MLHLEATRISSLAQSVLERSQEGRVLHVFPAGLYLETSPGDVVVLTSPGTPFGPLSVSVTGLAPYLARVAPESRVRWTGAVITADAVAVHLDRARVWQARPPWEDLRATLTEAPGLVAWLRVELLRRAPSGSLAEILQDPPHSPATRLLEAARSRALDLVTCLTAAADTTDQSAFDDVRRTAAALAGLGPGFTPSGDDYLMGAMNSMWVLLPPRLASSLSMAVAVAASQRTTTASGAYLRAAAAGAAGEGWHDLIQALSRSDPSATQAALRRLTTIGHTSGADALAGFIQVLDALLPGGEAWTTRLRPQETSSESRFEIGQMLPCARSGG